jgi:hypothetical protein
VLGGLSGCGLIACGGEKVAGEESPTGRVNAPLVGGTPVSADTVGAVNFVIPGFTSNLGSGGLVNGEWILTARHVVEEGLGFGKPIEIHLGDYPAAPAQRRALKAKNVVYHPTAGRDVALVKVEPPFVTSIARTFAPPPANPITCVGFGGNTTTGADAGFARSFDFMTQPRNLPEPDTCMFVAPYDSSNASRFGGGGGDSGSLCRSAISPNDIYGIATRTFPLYNQDEFEKVNCFGTWAQNVVSAKATAQLDFDGDGLLDNIRFYVSGGTLRFRVFRGASTAENTEADTTIPFDTANPLPVVVGNFNGDVKSGTSTGCDDVAIVAQGKLWPFLGNCTNSVESRGSLAFTGLTFTDAEIGLASAAGAAVELLASTGEVVTYSFSSTGSATASYAMGFPSASTADGVMLSLSGLGFDTVSANVSRLKVSQSTTQELSANRLKVEVFDGDFGQLNDGGANNATTCYQLVTDPCGDLAGGNCSLAANSGVVVTAKDGASLSDNAWSTLYDGLNDVRASTKGTTAGPFSYMVRAFLAEPGHDCASASNIPSLVDVAGVNVFKVRANARISRPTDEASFWGVARTGQWGAPSVDAFPGTNFNGVIDLKIAGALTGTEMLLEEFDADDLDDGTPGVAVGANSDIRFWVTRPDGNKATIAGGDYPGGTLIVENPSGNFNSDPASQDKDLETYSVNISGAPTGVWTWHWEGVGAHNNIKVRGPFGSPAAYELMGASVPRAVLSSAQPPSYWAGPGASSIHLPVVLGSVNSSGAAEGESIVIRTQSQAVGVLNGSPTNLRGRLVKQLLSAKLNIEQAHSLGEQLESALLYATTEGVDAVVNEADALVRGPSVLADTVRAERVAVLLDALNKADVTYLQPGVPTASVPAGDDDGDGFINLVDNCPSVANFTQLDSDADLVGDACSVVPRVECVLPLQNGLVRVYFGYTSPLSYRRIPVGRRNNLSLAGARPITVFQEGSHSRAFSVDASSASNAIWNVDGTTVSGNSLTPACGGVEILAEQPLANVALFGATSVTVADHGIVQGNLLSGGNLELGQSASAQDVRGKSNVWLRSNSVVHGSAVAGQSVSQQAGVTVEGSVVQNGFVGINPLLWNVAITGTATFFEVPNGSTLVLPATGLRTVNVRGGGTLRIPTGTYQLDALQIESGGNLIIDDANGPVTLLVRSSLFVRGPITRTAVGAPASSFLIGYFGTAAAFLEVPYRGSVVAPRATVVLGTGTSGQFEGQWFANAVEVRPNLGVRYSR